LRRAGPGPLSILLQKRCLYLYTLIEIKPQSIYLYSHVTFRSISTTIVLCSLLFVFSEPACAQEKLPDVHPVIQKEIWFDKLVGFENSGIINGPEYFIPMQGSTTHPFYGSRDLSLEWVVFKDQRYGNVALMYDIYGDILILRHRDKNGIFVLIQLEKEYVDAFTLYGHQFKKISIVDSNDKKQTPRFFDILFDGEMIDLVAERKKTIHVVDSRPQYQYEEKFYFLKNNRLIPLTSKKNIYTSSNRYDSRKNTQDFINKNKLNIRDEKDLLLIAGFCDSLNYEGDK
jgi:hypothetical protein